MRTDVQFKSDKNNNKKIILFQIKNKNEMLRFQSVVFLISLSISNFMLQGCCAWKPIVSEAAFTSTYSLKQTHPELSEKEPDSAEIVSSGASSTLSLTSQFPAQDARILTGSSLSDSSVEVPPAPLPFKFDETEHFGYSLPSSVLGGSVFAQKQCAVKKFAFNHDGTVEYEHKLPELSQFTICFWSRFTNHSGDHVILTYSEHKQPRAMQFWIANAMNSSFISMAIKGQQVYRLNYPLRMRQWHHTCSSWNGKTGEWQVWMKAERIGRGFHNALVGHKIPSNGKLFSGGPSVTGEVSQGLHFEITFVQIYRVALSAGKAHREHKHHHVHRLDHEGQEVSTTTKAPPVINRPQPMNALLANGQIPTRVRINLANPPQNGVNAPKYGFRAPNGQMAVGTIPITSQAATIQTSFVNGQLNGGSRLVAQQLLGLQSNLNLLPQTPTPAAAENAGAVQFIDETETRFFFKRQAESRKNTTKLRKLPRTAIEAKKVKKRELVLLNEGETDDYVFDGLAGFGDRQFKNDLNVKMSIEDEVSMHDREPAEEEVRAVMLFCSGCEAEPFQGAIVFAWKNVVENMDNVLKGNSVGGCGDF